jgi:type II secretory pathway component GspD/PulD (secretin)
MLSRKLIVAMMFILMLAVGSAQAGVFLSLQPFVGTETTEMFVNARISSVTGLTPQGLPIMASREVLSSVRTKDGQALLLGGLTRTEKVKQKSGMPFLSEIPGLGYLFGGETTIDRETNVVLSLDTTTTVGSASKMELPEKMATAVAQADGAHLAIPDNPFGFDQWLLDGEKQ